MQAMLRAPAPFRPARPGLHHRPHLAPRARHAQLRCRASEEVEVERFMLPVPRTAEELKAEGAWLAKQLHTWLDEEWAPLDAHPRLAEAAAAAYVRSRDRGQHEMGDVLLSMCSDLMEPLHSSDFFDSFTNAFEVGNKATEILMLRNGCDVCCTSDDDKARVARVDQLVLETLGGAPPAPGALAPTDLPRQS